MRQTIECWQCSTGYLLNDSRRRSIRDDHERIEVTVGFPRAHLHGQMRCDACNATLYKATLVAAVGIWTDRFPNIDFWWREYIVKATPEEIEHSMRAMRSAKEMREDEI